MYKPKNYERKPEQAQEVGGVVLSFARTRRSEARARLREFIKAPISWLQENEPIRKAILLEFLDLFPRPLIEVSHEHEVQKWSRRGVKK